MGGRSQTFREGRRARLFYDEGLGWTVMVRGCVLDSADALKIPVPRIRRLAQWVAVHNPDKGGLEPAVVPFIWPQRGSDKGGC